MAASWGDAVSRLTRAAAVAAAVLAGIAGGVSAPAAAFAASPPVVNWVVTNDQDWSRFRVSITAEANVTQITAHLFREFTTVEVATTRAFGRVDGTDSDGVWESASMLLPDLGAYRIDIEARDANGLTVRQDFAGTLLYYGRMFFDQMSTNRSEVTYTQRDVTVRGRLMGRWPNGRTEPLAGFEVSAFGYPPAGPGAAPTVVTRADGTFAATVTMGGPGWIQVTAPYTDAHPGFLQGQSDQLPITVRPAPTRLTLTLDKARAVYPEQVTVTGRLTRNLGGGFEPVADAYINVNYCSIFDTSGVCGGAGSTTTDADGNYTLTFTPSVSGWLEVGHSDFDPFLGTVIKTSRVISVLHQTQFTDFTATRSGSDQVNVQGHLKFLTGGNPVTVPVEIQYRPVDGGDWLTVATVQTTSTSAGHRFSATVTQPATGYWRAYYAGRPDLNLPATSVRVRVNQAIPQAA